MSHLNLNGKKALVTGASRGIGAGIAVAFAEAGADVALWARSKDVLSTVADKCAAYGRSAAPVPCDISDAEQVESAFATTMDRLGGLDILVNNAGGLDHIGPVLDLDEADWDHVWRMNVASVVRMLRLAGPVLTSQGSGSVINVGSIAGLNGVPGLAHYAAAKAALHSLTRSVACEWAPANVRVNAIAPGWIDTAQTHGFSSNSEFDAAIRSDIPQGRWGATSDVVGAAIYLASPAAQYTTGSVLVTDGGLSSQYFQAGTNVPGRLPV
ncbi:SDR family NAD(P)-dependent oxidoreductase [Natronoglycomyces albus]|uniref:SDR family oxidoreductase n=1 Tax=Natronoglycomyces albus TaxID=2811108 RepID=A0A895XS26_9ACTN|nr:SDR family oxidoreductase [Natronoglycomyces albus]QSB06492.1 SDR family oxidoreductase [Natronoglycomyces albus]